MYYYTTATSITMEINQSNIRNFCIIAHIDHGKSTLADRLLEFTGTIDKRKMQEQVLDSMDLERERGITIKLQPVRMLWKTRINADQDADKRGLLYEELTYILRGCVFNVYNNLGPGHKENIYQKALEEELRKSKLLFEKEKTINVLYNDKPIGIYRPDFVVDNKIIVEIKALPFLGQLEKKQTWHYLKGSDYRLAFLINFGGKELQIERIIYDNIRDNLRNNPQKSAEVEYILNLIDTPGHVDFNYEVSRSLAAVEGAILLVDATQGIQAQTLSNLYLAIEQDLVIIPVINKVDLPTANVEQVETDIVKLLGCKKEEVLKISAKTGLGVDKALEAVVREIPAPKNNDEKILRALIFDSYYDTFKGVVAYVKIVGGEVKAGDKIKMMASGAENEVLEVGIFAPELKKTDGLASGEIGWIATGLKEIEKCRAGDTITSLKVESGKWKVEKNKNNIQGGQSVETPVATCGERSQTNEAEPLPGYKEPKPVVYASFYPTEGDDYFYLREALSKLKLTDAAFTFEPESSSVLGKGFRCGFLGLLHLEIMAERIKREHNINFILTAPSVIYKIKRRNSENGDLELIYSASHLPLPEVIAEMHEPWAKVDVITPADYIGKVMTLMESIRGAYIKTDYINDTHVIIQYEAPLANIITDFHDNLKSISSGFASMSYDIIGWRRGDLVRLDILVGGDKVEAFSRIVIDKSAMEVGRNMASKLKDAIPRSQFKIPIQAAIGGKVIARGTINPYRKDVTKKLYGGDVTRKNKLLEKQKKGKKKMETIGKVEIPQKVFIEIMKK
jgi:GTP-binding protein LepA